MQQTCAMNGRVVVAGAVALVLVLIFVSMKRTDKSVVIPQTAQIGLQDDGNTDQGTSQSQRQDSQDGQRMRMDEISLKQHREKPLPSPAFQWKPPTLPLSLKQSNQSDQRLINHIRDHWILPPFTGPRNLTSPGQIHFSQRGQSMYIDDYLKKKRNGFFIECGAFNGEVNSNSLFLERERNWTGILIEANPIFFKDLVYKRRHSYMMNACLSPDKTPEILNFRLAAQIGGLVDFMEKAHQQRVQREKGQAAPIQIQCFPLPAILRALKVKHVDYFSLDIEGAEFEILKNFPFDEFQVDILTIEYVVSQDNTATMEKLKRIKELMFDRYGYHQTSYKGAEDIMIAKGV